MPKFCPECGENISDKIKFCPSCGANINSYIATIGDNKNEQTLLVNLPENFPSNESVEPIVSNKENEIRYQDTTIQQQIKKKSLIFNIMFGIIVVLALIILVITGLPFLTGMVGNIRSTGSESNLLPIQSTPSNLSSPNPTESPTDHSTQSKLPLLIPTESQTERNTRIANEIVSNYHKTHIYSLNDMYVCVDMASDIWDMLKAQGIDAKINVGNINKDITDIKDADHAWVLAEIAPNSYLALEATGGYSVQKADNPRYYYGWSFDNPKELKDAYDKLKHPCSAGYILGNDNLCHQACGGNTYCSGNSVCVNGQCKGCNPGYILGDDFRCYQECPPSGSRIYCKIGTCGTDGKCHL